MTPPYQGEERRLNNALIHEDIALIKKDLEYIREKIDGNLNRFEEHVESSQAYRDRVLELGSLESKFTDHLKHENLMFTILTSVTVSTLAGVLYKIFS